VLLSPAPSVQRSPFSALPLVVLCTYTREKPSAVERFVVTEAWICGRMPYLRHQPHGDLPPRSLQVVKAASDFPCIHVTNLRLVASLKRPILSVLLMDCQSSSDKLRCKVRRQSLALWSALPCSPLTPCACSGCHWRGHLCKPFWCRIFPG